MHGSARFALRYFKQGEIVIRAFIALRLSEEITASIHQTIDYLKREGVRGAWINPRQAHITLEFFEDISQNEIKLLTDGLRIALSRIVLNIEISMGVLGSFPNTKRPRVIWIEIKTAGQDLIRLKDVLDREVALHTNQKTEKRAFKPHLTLVRLKESGHLDLEKWSHQLALQNIPSQRINAITIFQSELNSNGAKHIAIAEILLRNFS